MRYLAVSSAWPLAFARGSPDLVGRHHYEVHPDLPEAWKVAHRLALGGETVRPDQEERWVRADGAEQWLRWTVFPWCGDDGEIGGIVISAEDVTADRALRLSEARLSEIVSVSADAIISVDAQRNVTMFNRGAERIFGYAATEMVGKRIDVLIPEPLRAAHARHLTAFADGPDAARPMHQRGATIFALRKNGEEFPADAAISKVEVEGTKVLTVILRDITDRERAAHEERITAEAGRILISAGYDGNRVMAEIGNLLVRQLADWCIIDRLVEEEDGRLVRVVRSRPAQAQACASIARSPVDPGRPRGFWRELGSGVRWVGDVERDGLESLVREPEDLRLIAALDPRSIVVAPISGRGRVGGTIAIGTSGASRPFDATDAKLLERLAGIIALTDENIRLHRALEAAVLARDEVLGIVAHDLRNPLNSILLHAQTLRRRGQEPDRRDQTALSHIRVASLRMNRLIQDLLDTARLEGGQRLTVERQAVSPASLVAAVVEEQKDWLAAAKRVVNVDVEPDLPDVFADNNRLHQAFDNLLGNAAKFSLSNTTITVGASFENGEVVFRVHNEGVIAADALPHVFERFWKASGADLRGAGLGLSIVKQIIDAHDGRIWVDSSSTHGTTFHFTVPLANHRRT